MPFIATCSYCRGSKFRVPFKKRGTFATCPRCAREFLLTPESGDVPLMNYRELPFEDPLEDSDAIDEVDADLDGSSELVETLPDETPAAKDPPPRIESVAVLVAPLRPATDLPMRFALVAFGLFGLTMLATLFPYGRLIAAPLALVGFLLAGMGWLGLDRYTWLGSVGAALNGLALVLLVAFPSWLGVAGWMPEADPEAAPKLAMAVGRGDNLARPAEWVDAAQAVWRQGDVQIAITEVSLQAADSKARRSDKKHERVLSIGIRMRNAGVARAIAFAGWNQSPAFAPKLTAAGTDLALRTAPTDRALVYPDKNLDSTIVFAAPETLDDLRLELPPAAFGGDEPVRFQIPKAMIFGR